MRRTQWGATLMEIIIAMVVIGMVATGVLTAFVFSRKVTWRSGTELSGAGLVQQTADRLRGAVNAGAGGGPAGLTLNPGIYVDQAMQNAPSSGAVNPTQMAGLNFPGDFARFQTSPGGQDPDLAPPITINRGNHGDGQLVVVEGLNDLDGDGLTGLDFNGDGQPDLRRVRIRVKWTTPST